MSTASRDLALLGLGLLVLGAVLLLRARGDLRRHRRLRRARPARLASARDGLVEVSGTVVPGEAGTLRAPLSGRRVVWFRVVVSEAQRGEDEPDVDLVDESDSREFFLEDGRARVRIEPAAAHVAVRRQTVAKSGLFRDPTPALARFLESRGHEGTTALGFNRKLTYREERIHPGDTLSAIGEARRRALPTPDQASYRRPETELTVSAPVNGEDELILTTRSRLGLGARLLAMPVAAVLSLIAGLVLLIVALAR